MNTDPNAVAVITDIHGNLPALQAALARIEELGIDQVFCGGDLVGYGPHPNEVCALIAERGIPTIYGNYDYAIARDEEDCGCAYVTPHDRELGQLSVDWTLAHTSQESKDFMRGLPFDLHFSVGDTDAHLVHGSPRKVNEYLFEDKPARLYERLAAAERDPRPRLRPYPQTVGPRVRRGTVRQLRLGRQAQGRRPPRRLRRAQAAATSVDVSIERVDYDAELSLLRSTRLGYPASSPTSSWWRREDENVLTPAAGAEAMSQPLPRRLLAEFLGSAFLAALVIGSGIAAQTLSPGRSGPRAVGERRRHRGGPVRDHPHVRTRLRRAFQPGRLARRRELRRHPLAPRPRLHARAGRRLCARRRRRQRHVLPGRRSALHASPRLARAPVLRGDRDRRLLLVIFSLARTKRATPIPAAVGAYIGAAYFFTSSTSFANPAISIGRMFSRHLRRHRTCIGAGLRGRPDRRGRGALGLLASALPRRDAAGGRRGHAPARRRTPRARFNL